MASLLLLFFLAWPSSSSMPNCQYFGLETGPLIPMSTCLKWNTASYSYECHGFAQIRLHWFPDSDRCQGLEEISENAIYPIVQNCGGGICDHVTIRQYERGDNDQENECYKNETEGFIEYAFVTDCWDSIVMPSKSWYCHSFLSLYIWIQITCR